VVDVAPRKHTHAKDKGALLQAEGIRWPLDPQADLSMFTAGLLNAWQSRPCG